MLGPLEAHVVIGGTLGFFALAAVLVIVLLRRRGVGAEIVLGSRNRFTGQALNWYLLVVLAYCGIAVITFTLVDAFSKSS